MKRFLVILFVLLMSLNDVHSKKTEDKTPESQELENNDYHPGDAKLGIPPSGGNIKEDESNFIVRAIRDHITGPLKAWFHDTREYLKFAWTDANLEELYEREDVYEDGDDYQDGFKKPIE